MPVKIRILCGLCYSWNVYESHYFHAQRIAQNHVDGCVNYSDDYNCVEIA